MSRVRQTTRPVPVFTETGGVLQKRARYTMACRCAPAGTLDLSARRIFEMGEKKPRVDHIERLTGRGLTKIRPP